MVELRLEHAFPGLRGQSYQITSKKDGRYNCIAFATGDIRNWWWPDLLGEDTWPDGVARVETIEAFRDAFATLGYVVCDHEQLESGFEKVALFTLALKQAYILRIFVPSGDFGPGRTLGVQPARTAVEGLFGVVHGRGSFLRLSP